MAKKNICMDIETARGYEDLKSAPEEIRNAWINYSKNRFADMKPDESYKEKAGLFPEFGQIVCVTVMVKGSGVQTFSQDKREPGQEKALLVDLAAFCDQFAEFRFIGHNIKKFDIPFMNVRFVANELKLPDGFRTYGVKPWEMSHWDTWEIWKGGVFGSSQAASLEVVCAVLGIQSPKAEFSGAEVGDVFFSDDPEAIDKIVKYCERDVLATATALRQMSDFGMF